jgi:hypothetical protein
MIFAGDLHNDVLHSQLPQKESHEYTGGEIITKAYNHGIHILDPGSLQVPDTGPGHTSAPSRYPKPSLGSLPVQFVRLNFQSACFLISACMMKQTANIMRPVLIKKILDKVSQPTILEGEKVFGDGKYCTS